MRPHAFPEKTAVLYRKGGREYLWLAAEPILNYQEASQRRSKGSGWHHTTITRLMSGVLAFFYALPVRRGSDLMGRLHLAWLCIHITTPGFICQVYLTIIERNVFGAAKEEHSKVPDTLPILTQKKKTPGRCLLGSSRRSATASCPRSCQQSVTLRCDGEIVDHLTFLGFFQRMCHLVYPFLSFSALRSNQPGEAATPWI